MFIPDGLIVHAHMILHHKGFPKLLLTHIRGSRKGHKVIEIYFRSVRQRQFRVENSTEVVIVEFMLLLREFCCDCLAVGCM